jgi:hypothetical protein
MTEGNLIDLLKANKLTPIPLPLPVACWVFALITGASSLCWPITIDYGRSHAISFRKIKDPPSPCQRSMADRLLSVHP